MLNLYLNPSPETCIKTFDTKGGGEGVEAAIDTTCAVMSSRGDIRGLGFSAS